MGVERAAARSAATAPATAPGRWPPGSADRKFANQT